MNSVVGCCSSHTASLFEGLNKRSRVRALLDDREDELHFYDEANRMSIHNAHEQPVAADLDRAREAVSL
jgi:hypothetical protein